MPLSDLDDPAPTDLSQAAAEHAPRRDRLIDAVDRARDRVALARGHVGLVTLVAAASVLVAVMITWVGRPQHESVALVDGAATAQGVAVGDGQSAGDGAPAGPPPAEVVSQSHGPTEVDPPAVVTSDPLDTGAGAPLVIHVAGRVREPGVLRLPPGSRVVDAVEAAGGARARAALSEINLARVLLDGEQVVIPGQSAGRASGVGTASAKGAADAIDDVGAAPPVAVSLSQASLDDLDALPGIGPVLAERIVEWRTAHGPFTTVQGLLEVSGIGPATLADIEPLVRP